MNVNSAVRQVLAIVLADRNRISEVLAQHRLGFLFNFEHLQDTKLLALSGAFARLGALLVATPANNALDEALRFHAVHKLVEAKDAAVRLYLRRKPAFEGDSDEPYQYLQSLVDAFDPRDAMAAMMRDREEWLSTPDPLSMPLVTALSRLMSEPNKTGDERLVAFSRSTESFIFINDEGSLTRESRTYVLGQHAIPGSELLSRDGWCVLTRHEAFVALKALADSRELP